MPNGYTGKVFAFQIPRVVRPEHDEVEQSAPDPVGSAPVVPLSWMRPPTMANMEDPRNPRVNIYQPSENARIDLHDPGLTLPLLVRHRLGEGETLFTVAEQYLGVPEIWPLLDMAENTRWKRFWNTDGVLPQPEDTVVVPNGRVLDVAGTAANVRGVYLSVNGPTEEQYQVDAGDTTTLPGRDDADWRQSVAVRPGDYVMTASNSRDGMGEASRQITFTVTGEARTYDVSVHNLCYVPSENSLLMVTDALQYDMDQEARRLDDLITAVANAEAHDDATATAEAKAALDHALAPLMSSTAGESALTEVVGYRGRKYTYVRSEHVRNHWQSYSLDSDGASRLTNADGQFDLERAKASLADDFSSMRLNFAQLDRQFQQQHLNDWAEEWNTGEHQGRDWLAASSHFSATTESVLLRYTLGASLSAGLRDGMLGLRGEGSANLELASGRATLAGHLPNEDGLHVQFELTNREGSPVEFDIGYFRLTTQVVLSGYAGAKAAVCVNLELDMAEGQALLRGLSNDEAAEARERDDLFQPVEAELNAFAGVSGACELTGALEWQSVEADNEFRALARLGGEMSVQAGVGATAGLYLGYERGTFMFRARAGATLGVGYTGAAIATVHAEQVYDLVQFVYHQLKDNDYGFLDFVQQNAFEILHRTIFESIVLRQPLILEASETIQEAYYNWFALTEDLGRVIEFAQGILADEEQLMPFTPPETKATMLRLLTTPIETLRDRLELRRDDRQLRENAIRRVLTHITSYREFLKVLDRMGPDGPLPPSQTDWDFTQGRRRLMDVFNTEGMEWVHEWSSGLPATAMHRQPIDKVLAATPTNPIKPGTMLG